MWGTEQEALGAWRDPAILVANGPTRLFNPTIKQSSLIALTRTIRSCGIGVGRVISR